MKALLRIAGLAAAFMAVSLLTAPSAAAHATYKSSDPPDEGTVSSAPSEITAEFTEPMSNGSYMDVTDPCGRDVGSGSEQTGSSMRVLNSGTVAGTYVVYWLAKSIDSHTTTGEFTFTVTNGDPCPGEKEPKEPGTRGSGGNGGDETSVDQGETEENTTVAAAGSGSGDNSSGEHSQKKHGKHRDMKHRAKQGSRGSNGRPVAAGADADVPDAPSALEGIPMDGLVITLAISALIGAAAGKIYVSLSGEDS